MSTRNRNLFEAGAKYTSILWALILIDWAVNKNIEDSVFLVLITFDLSWFSGVYFENGGSVSENSQAYVGSIKLFSLINGAVSTVAALSVYREERKILNAKRFELGKRISPATFVLGIALLGVALFFGPNYDTGSGSIKMSIDLIGGEIVRNYVFFIWISGFCIGFYLFFFMVSFAFQEMFG